MVAPSYSDTDPCYSTDELLSFGFRSVGQSVRVARSCQLYLDESSIDSNVRIDGPSVLSGRLKIGSNIHIASFCRLAGGDSGILLEDEVGISSHCAVYAVSEDFADSGAFGNPTHRGEQQRRISQPVRIGRRTIVGTGSIILPGVTIGECCALSAGVVIRKSLPANMLVLPFGQQLKVIPRKMIPAK